MMSIRKQLTVEAPLDRAFRVFTANMGAWWPKEHHIGKAALKDCVIEPKVNGRWYERGEDGSECEWGKVLEWDPPRRLVLAWQLNEGFQYDPALVTEVEVTFTLLGPKQTRVDFEHRNLERFGEAAERLRGLMGEGWGQILESYKQTAVAAAA
ncbi:MAG TPA: SRPBCC family protein [Candidatus Binatia bacterium]|nr:SRPBCC family protein [Candidatus Binatia bacterium]